MREIDFRAWDSFNRVWKEKKHANPWMGMVKTQYIVTEYTGLKDKNGTKIFEGDFLRFTLEV